MDPIASPGFAASARSALGLLRTGNEDSALLHSRLIAVADGMGGHAGGEVASALAITTLAGLIKILEEGELDADSAEDLLLHSLHDVDGEIGRAARAQKDLLGMGTTLSALMLYNSGDESSVALLHVGDSRCYRLREGELLQLSHDHTVLQEMLDQKIVSTQEALEHPHRSLLTQAVMGEDSLSPVLMVYPIEINDRFLLCSDGLSGVIDEKEIKSSLKISDRDEAIAHMIELVYQVGAPDNVTIVIADLIAESSSTQITFLGAAG